LLASAPCWKKKSNTIFEHCDFDKVKDVLPSAEVCKSQIFLWQQLRAMA
jgi:hypothetical protein